MGELDANQVEGLMNEAARRMPGLIYLPHLTALRTAQQYRISAYDARFMATAETLGTKRVTEDTKLRQAAPTLALSLAQALANR